MLWEKLAKCLWQEHQAGSCHIKVGRGASQGPSEGGTGSTAVSCLADAHVGAYVPAVRVCPRQHSCVSVHTPAHTPSSLGSHHSPSFQGPSWGQLM